MAQFEVQKCSLHFRGDPYLEQPELWPEVHSRLIVAIADALAPQLRPKYRVALEKRVYQTSGEEDTLVVGIPDVAVQRSLSSTNLRSVNIAVASPPVRPVTVTMPFHRACQ